MRILDRDIREYLGHGKGNRRVRVRSYGIVEYYGSTDDTDRDHDYWHFGGYRNELVRAIERQRDREVSL